MKKQTNMDLLMQNYQDKIDSRIIHTYSPGTKIAYLEKVTRLNKQQLAFLFANGHYLHDCIDLMKRIIPVEYHLLYMYHYVPTLYKLEVNPDFETLLLIYHIDKDDKYFTWWCNEYFKNEDDFIYEECYIEETIEIKDEEENVLDSLKDKLKDKDLTYVKPGEVEYNIGHYKNNPIRIDDMIITNWKYAYYIISQFDNSPFQHLFYYIYKKLIERQKQGFINPDVEIKTMIPLSTLKSQYEAVWKSGK